MRARAAGLLFLAIGCRTPHRTPPPLAAPPEGISIMVYAHAETSYGVVDDRRWIDVAGPSFALDRIDPGAALPSLVIEPVGADPLRVGACSRERIDTTAEGLQRLAQARPDKPAHPADGDDPPPLSNRRVDPVGLLSPLVRCAVTASPGRHLVRVLYVAPTIQYRTEHAIAVTDDAHATITTRFALATPSWNQRAAVTLFDGLPGGDEAPREIAHGSVVLDGGTALLAVPPRVVAAKLRRVFDGAIHEHGVAASDVAWGKDSRSGVWVWLELEGELRELRYGLVRAHVELAGEPPRDAVLPDRTQQDRQAIGRERRGTTLRVPLWADGELHGVRRRWIDRSDATTLVERFQLSVSSSGTAPRDVWIEERLRPAKHRELSRGAPNRPGLDDSFARAHLVVAPGGSESIGFVISYEL